MKRKAGTQKRTNQHWTNKEKQRLLALFEGGTKYIEIAKIMGRSETAVRIKMSHLIKQLSKPRKTVVTDRKSVV